MAPLPKFLCFLDFETTSLDPATTTVLEVFWELTDWDLNPAASGHGLNRAAETLDMDDYVRNMHANSGLFDAAAHHTGYSVGQALLTLAMALGDIGELVPLAGSGVGHFDRLVIAAQHPAIAGMLTYWSLDLGPIRRLAEGTGYGDLALPAIDIVHRAEADVRRAQAEYRQWRAVFDIARDATTEVPA